MMKKRLAAVMMTLALLGATVPPALAYANGELDDWTADRSAWAEEELNYAMEIGLVPDELLHKELTKPITRGEFAALAVRTYEVKNNTTIEANWNLPFSDAIGSPYEGAIRKAYTAGLTNGTDGGLFQPNAYMTRQELATMLTRVYKAYRWPSWTLERDEFYRFAWPGDDKFADDAKIREYARDSIYFMAKYQIVIGKGNNMIAPEDNTSREEAIVMALRLYKDT